MSPLFNSGFEWCDLGNPPKEVKATESMTSLSGLQLTMMKPNAKMCVVSS